MCSQSVEVSAYYFSLSDLYSLFVRISTLTVVMESLVSSYDCLPVFKTVAKALNVLEDNANHFSMAVEIKIFCEYHNNSLERTYYQGTNPRV